MFSHRVGISDVSTGQINNAIQDGRQYRTQGLLRYYRPKGTIENNCIISSAGFKQKGEFVCMISSIPDASSCWFEPVARKPRVVSTWNYTEMAWLPLIGLPNAGAPSSMHGSTHTALGNLNWLISQSSSLRASKSSSSLNTLSLLILPFAWSSVVPVHPFCSITGIHHPEIMFKEHLTNIHFDFILVSALWLELVMKSWSETCESCCCLYLQALINYVSQG